MTQLEVPMEFSYPIRQIAQVRRRQTACTTLVAVGSYRIAKRGRLWELRDAAGELVCLTAYKKGAIEVVRRLSAVVSPSTKLPP